MTKQELYEQIERLAHNHSLSPKERIGLDPLVFASQFSDLEIIKTKFDSHNIFAMLLKDKYSTMVLNSSRDYLSIKFDCMHELIHYFWHDKKTYKCTFANGKPQIKSYYEWEANEGAAEFLIPYKVFIPLFCKLNITSQDIETDLAKHFKLSVSTIKNRINSLEYEIRQYMSGTKLESLNLLSLNAIKKHNIILDISIKHYCPRCHNVEEYNQNFCSICGNSFKNFQENKLLKEVPQMFYTGIKIVECKTCKNEQIDKDDKFCIICGNPLQNFCTNEDCNRSLLSHARFCPSCSSESTFYKEGYLLPFNESKSYTKKEYETLTKQLKPIDEDEGLPF